MISSLFGKSRPVNYILVLSLLFLFFLLLHLGSVSNSFETLGVLQGLLGLGCLLFSVFIVNFIVQRNQLTATHSYAMLLYALLVIFFPETLADPGLIFASFFLLLAHRRLISLRSLRNPRGKIFDGALWILVGSLFFSPLVFLLLLVWLYIYFYVPKQLNYWLIPFAAAGVVALMGWSAFYLAGDPGYLLRHFETSFQKFYLSGFSKGQWIKMAVFAFLVVLCTVLSFVRQGKSGQGKLTQLRLLLMGWVLVVLVIAFAGDNTGSAILLAFFPSAVFMARYLDSIRREYIRDILLTGFAVLSLLGFFLQWVAA